MCHVSQTFSGSWSKTAGKIHKLRNRTGLSLKYQYFVQRIELSLYKDKERKLWLFNCSKNRYLENRILSKNITLHELFNFICLAESLFISDFCAWIHVRVCHFVCILFHLYMIHAQFCVIGNSALSHIDFIVWNHFSNFKRQNQALVCRVTSLASGEFANRDASSKWL